MHQLTLFTCNKCKDKYIGSAVDFKPRFRVHKSDIKTKSDCYGTTRLLNGRYNRSRFITLVILSTKVLKLYPQLTKYTIFFILHL